MPNRARMPERSLCSRAVAGLVLFALAAACNSPTAPSRNPTPPSEDRTQPSQTRPDLTGPYTLTLSASSRSRLALPQDFRTRTYPATIGQADGTLVITVHHSRFPGWDIGRFTGVFGETNDVMFQMALEDWFAGTDYQAEYHTSGRMIGAIVEEGLSGILDGVVEAVVRNEDGRGSRVVTCAAPEQQRGRSRRPFSMPPRMYIRSARGAHPVRGKGRAHPHRSHRTEASFSLKSSGLRR